MLAVSLVTGSLAALFAAQSPPPAPACYLLTTAEVATLVGSTAPQITTTTSSTGTSGTCLYQHAGAVVTVLMVKLATEDAAKEQFQTKKRLATGLDVAGWPAPAYTATIDTPQDHAAIVGIVSSLTLVEVKAVDRTQKAADLTAKLHAAMKAFSARLAAQK
jgi:hypothetical protein